MNSVRRWMGRAACASLLAVTVAGAETTLRPQAAQAQVAYGSYVGLGAGVGFTNDAATGQGSGIQGVIAGRYRFLTMPISARAQAFVFGDSFAVVPTISYDFPLSWNADAYIGAGVSIPSGGNTPSIVGDKTAFVLQPGVDYMFPNSNLVAFGNAIFAFDAYRTGSNTAISVQGGVGIQF